MARKFEGFREGRKDYDLSEESREKLLEQGIIATPEEVFGPALGKKPGDYVTVWARHMTDETVSGRIVGIDKETQALVLEQPHNYRLTGKGFVKEKHWGRIRLAPGTPLKIEEIDKESLEGLAQKIPLVDHIGKDLVLGVPGGNVEIGRLHSVFLTKAFLSPYVRPDGVLNPHYSIVKDMKYPISVESVAMEELAQGLEGFVGMRNKQLDEERNGKDRARIIIG